jgi:hypothetical protein
VSRKAIFRQSGGAVKNLIAKTSLAYAKIPRPLRCKPRRRVQLTPQPLNVNGKISFVLIKGKFNFLFS